jgi:alpha-L-rhamnosidase
VIGRETDAERYRRFAAESADAWVEAFLDAGTGLVHNGSQSCQALALGFNAAPANARLAMFNRLGESVTQHDDGPQLTTGIFGTRLLLEQLSQRGQHDLAYALATRTAFPSWGWMLENGATTLWETWEQSDNRFSHNHPMFGSISAWFYRHLGGIQIAEDAVGADRLIIHPQPAGDLTWVKSSHHTVRGRVVSNWHRTGQGFAFEITIPPDASATIVLPSGTVTESGKPLAEAEGIQVVESAGISATTMKATSGRYRFLVTF